MAPRLSAKLTFVRSLHQSDWLEEADDVFDFLPAAPAVTVPAQGPSRALVNFGRLRAHVLGSAVSAFQRMVHASNGVQEVGSEMFSEMLCGQTSGELDAACF
jgi:hypothetical protein